MQRARIIRQPERALGGIARRAAGARTALAALLALALWAPSGAVPAQEAGRQSGERGLVTVRHIALRAAARDATLTLMLSGQVAPRLFRLAHPDRLVIDLPHTRRRAALPAGSPTRWVTAMRSGVRPGQELRLVLQLQGSSVYRLQWLSPTQLRIELAERSVTSGVRPRDSDAPRARAMPQAADSARSAAGGAAGSLDVAAAAIRAAHAPAAQREVIVAVDPGHGGVDPGATGPDGVHEKDVTLAIARALAARIDAAPGMHALLTRNGDYFVPLRERMQRARAAHADLFVSIHADSVRDPLVSGASVYTLSERGASSEAARQLAEQENAADLKGGISLSTQAPDLRSVLLNLSQDASMGQSGEAAQDVLHALDRIGPVRKLEVQHAAFVVLKSPDVPSMLVETAYISNRLDERRLRAPAQQQRLAAAIFSGIAAYFQQYPPQGSLFAGAHAVASSPSS